VIFVVVTDGQENASIEFSKTDIEKMVKEKKQRGWQFVFLSTDLEAMNDARELAVPVDSSLFYSKSRKGSAAAWASLSGHSSALRRARGRKTQIGFAPEERKRASSDGA
jgi:hypothetical protein